MTILKENVPELISEFRRSWKVVGVSKNCKLSEFFEKKILGSILSIFREVMTKNRSGDQNRGKGRGGFLKMASIGNKEIKKLQLAGKACVAKYSFRVLVYWYPSFFIRLKENM